MVMSALLTVTGCAQSDLMGKTETGPAYLAGPALPLEDLPNYTVGEAFVFDDGRTDTVIERSGEKVTWRDDRGIIRYKYRNFMIPDIGWQNNTRRSTSKTTAQPGMLWPLSPGNDVRFEFLQIVDANDGSSHNEYAQSWQCSVESTETIDVPAGTFSVFKIPCHRYTQGTSNWRQTRTHYYAPSVKHYVKRTDVYRSRPSRNRELVSYGFNSTVLAESDQRSLNQTLQAALNTNADGIPAQWNSGNGTLTAKLTPLRTYRGANGVECREYSSSYNVQGRQRTNYRNVCRKADGLWQRVL